VVRDNKWVPEEQSRMGGWHGPAKLGRPHDRGWPDRAGSGARVPGGGRGPKGGMEPAVGCDCARGADLRPASGPDDPSTGSSGGHRLQRGRSSPAPAPARVGAGVTDGGRRVAQGPIGCGTWANHLTCPGAIRPPGASVGALPRPRPGDGVGRVKGGGGGPASRWWCGPAYSSYASRRRSSPEAHRSGFSPAHCPVAWWGGCDGWGGVGPGTRWWRARASSCHAAWRRSTSGAHRSGPSLGLCPGTGRGGYGCWGRSGGGRGDWFRRGSRSSSERVRRA